MAGGGTRFTSNGYIIPKPLLPINGVPMVVKAVLDLPMARDYIFICLTQHIEDYQLDRLIQKHIPLSTFVSIPEVTDGQARTCLIGLERINNESELLIAACDNGIIYDHAKFEYLKMHYDVIVFSFRNNQTVVDKASQYAWIKPKEESSKIEYVSVKHPISDNPIYDHAVVGVFWFRTVGIFKQSANRMIGNNKKINQEFYVDECVNDAIGLGYRVGYFEVDKYICWGTPNDYKTYSYWQSFFK